jgi:L-aspartate oxidase
MSETGRLERYLTNFDTDHLRRIETDFVVVGSGNAGLRATIELAQRGRVLILSKENPSEGSTRYAQGGIAVALSEEDRVEFHIEDTLRAGAGLCDENAVRVLVEDGILRVQELLDWGARFDRNGTQLAFGMEGAHGVRRVVHRGDATGAETQEVLTRRALNHANVEVLDHTFAVDLLTENGVCVGTLVLTRDGELVSVFARATILASGGLGQLFGYTSNPAVATGDGIALAFRAGATLADMEFVQFHPTTLLLEGAPRFLISEAVRGEGAILLNIHGERFMSAYDPREELAPRDIVSRAILNEMMRTGVPYVYLDITHRPKDFLTRRFPTIYKTCLEYGLDIATDAMPVQPAAHFMMGGVWTDISARTTLQGLFACGEVACTMVHGANRLASNSLLEGLVFGARSGQSAVEYAATVPMAALSERRIVSQRTTAPVPAERLTELRATVTRQMWEHVGIRREKATLETALNTLHDLPADAPTTREGFEYANLRLLGELVARGALERTESRGAHYRTDFPQTDDVNWKRRVYQRRTDDGRIEIAVR